MPALALISGILCLATWIYLLTAHGGFWKVGRLQADVPPVGAINGTVAVVIPARDESELIGPAIRSLLEQSCAESIHIFVVDDHSSDGTADAVRNAADRSGRSAAVTVITGSALPAGWTGKLWAMQQGIQEAMQRNPKYLLLTDADIRH